MSYDNLFVIVTGTDPRSGAGGIAQALPNYFMALESVGIEYKFIATHHATERYGKWLPWLRALPVIALDIIKSRRDGKKTVVYGHAGPGVSLLRQSILMFIARILGANTLLQLHSITISHYLNNKLKRFFLKITIMPVSALAVLTPWWVERLKNNGVAKNIFLISNPVPVCCKKIVSKTKGDLLKKGIVNILSMTRLVQGKGVDLVIESLPFLNDDIHVTIAGDGPEMYTLKERVRTIGQDDKVRFTGWISGDEKHQIFQESDIFCLPSMYDSFGMGYVEAMTYGLPVVAMNWGPIKDVVPNGKVGVLIDDNNPQKLALAINQLSCDTEFKKYSENAVVWVREKYGVEVIGKQILSAIRKIIE